MSDNQLIKILAMLYRAHMRGDIDEPTWLRLVDAAHKAYAPA